LQPQQRHHWDLDRSQQGKKKFTNAVQRWEARRNYDRIGEILRHRQIYRIVFLSCSLGASPEFMDNIATDWGVQVAAFKFHVTVKPPDNFPDGKARFVFKSDIDTPGQGTNTPWARVLTPSLDDNSIAYVTDPCWRIAVETIRDFTAQVLPFPRNIL
jgi:hypothetical protein